MDLRKIIIFWCLAAPHTLISWLCCWLLKILRPRVCPSITHDDSFDSLVFYKSANFTFKIRREKLNFNTVPIIEKQRKLYRVGKFVAKCEVVWLELLAISFQRQRNIIERFKLSEMTYACSICPRNSSIYSNSFSLTKWTNFILLNLSIVEAFSSVAYSICSALSLTLRAARSICNTTVQSLPPLKLKAICSGLNRSYIKN